MKTCFPKNTRFFRESSKKRVLILPPPKKKWVKDAQGIYIYVTWFQPTSVIFLAGGFKHVLFSTFVPMIIRIDWGANFWGWSRPPVFADGKSFGQLFGPQLATNSVRSLGFGQLFHAPRLLGALNEFLEDCANGPSPLKQRFSDDRTVASEFETDSFPEETQKLQVDFVHPSSYI